MFLSNRVVTWETADNCYFEHWKNTEKHVNIPYPYNTCLITFNTWNVTRFLKTLPAFWMTSSGDQMEIKNYDIKRNWEEHIDDLV